MPLNHKHTLKLVTTKATSTSPLHRLKQFHIWKEKLSTKTCTYSTKGLATAFSFFSSPNHNQSRNVITHSPFHITVTQLEAFSLFALAVEKQSRKTSLKIHTNYYRQLKLSLMHIKALCFILSHRSTIDVSESKQRRRKIQKKNLP